MKHWTVLRKSMNFNWKNINIYNHSEKGQNVRTNIYLKFVSEYLVLLTYHAWLKQIENK